MMHFSRFITTNPVVKPVGLFGRRMTLQIRNKTMITVNYQMGDRVSMQDIPEAHGSSPMQSSVVSVFVFKRALNAMGIGNRTEGKAKSK